MANQKITWLEASQCGSFNPMDTRLVTLWSTTARPITSVLLTMTKEFGLVKKLTNAIKSKLRLSPTLLKKRRTMVSILKNIKK